MNKMIDAVVALIVLSALACGSASSVSERVATVSPITLGGDLTTIDVCRAVPPEDMEAVMSRKLIGAPQPFEYCEQSKGYRICRRVSAQSSLLES